jgi:choline dehydrogenase-like flavoprotein
MSRIVVVGSGATGVHFALTALERGHDVTMLDVGHERPPPVLPHATFDQLKEDLPDPVSYFLGGRGEGVVYPSTAASYYGHPPSKQYVFDVPAGFAMTSSAMSPRFSFARGGFAEAWTAGTYAYNETDLSLFPVDYDEMRRCYATVSRRIGIGGVRDDLERFIPFDDIYLEPLPLDPHSRWLWDRYHRRRERLQRELGFYLGRSRVATLSRPFRDRDPCEQLGRCLWGCPTHGGAIYSPLSTLHECMTHSRFRYVPGVLARRFEYATDGRVTRVVAKEKAGGETIVIEGELFALAGGALSSSKIVLDSRYWQTKEIGLLSGLMDNLQIHVPFLTPAMIGTKVQTASYQFHHLAIGVVRPDPLDYVHGQITTLKSASVHPIVQNLPFDLRGAAAVFRAIRAGLAVVNVNLPDRRRADSQLTIRPRGESEETELVIRYVEDPGERGRMESAVRSVKQALQALGCFVPPGMTRVLPRGTSVHYAGTMPMSTAPGDFTCSSDGRSHAHENLYVVDGASFPFLPSKNHTFTLMANAVRVAQTLRRGDT